ncbi:MAG: hypothetical protein J0L92_14425 [Deltaproteobacteria bacterium]|nr:hypothetical protein [Deltaproteobacteria bacterium]
MRISNSFSEGEIQVLDFILTTLLRGGTPAMAVRSKDFASVCRKVQAMKTKAGDIREGRIGPKRVPDKSSVGLIDAPDAAEESMDDEGLSEVG